MNAPTSGPVTNPWEIAPQAALGRALELALKGDLDGVFQAVRSWPDPPPWPVTDRRTVEVDAAYERMRRVGATKVPIRLIGLFDVLAIALDARRDLAEGPPSSAARERIELRPQADLPHQAPEWTPQHSAFWRDAVQWALTQPSTPDRFTSPIQQLFQAVVQRTRLDGLADDLLAHHADAILRSPGEIRDVLPDLHKQGRISLAQRIIARMMLAECTSDADGSYPEASIKLFAFTANRLTDPKGGNETPAQFWGPAWTAARTAAAADQDPDNTPLGDEQRAAIETLGNLGDRLYKTTLLAVFALRHVLEVSKSNNMHWQRSWVTSLIDLADRGLR